MSMTVSIDGKEFALEHTNIARRSNTLEGFTLQPVVGVFVDDETLFTTATKEVRVNGAPVRLFSASYKWVEPQKYMSSLRKLVESEIVKEGVDKQKRSLPKISTTLQSVLDVMPYLGKQQIAMSNGGYGDCEPIWSFVGITLKKNVLNLEIFRDEEVATRKTQEAVEFIYGRAVQKKKGLSPEAKQEYDSEVRELLKGLDINNLEERTAYLEELYNDLKA